MKCVIKIYRVNLYRTKSIAANANLYMLKVISRHVLLFFNIFDKRIVIRIKSNYALHKIKIQNT